MPVYEYICRACSRAFEELVIGGETPHCPSCASIDLQKQFSVFAAGGTADGAGEPSGQGACGTCGDPRGPGACAMN